MFNLILRFFLACCTLALIESHTYADKLNVASHLDLKKYEGEWYEIARFPNPFQKRCQKNVVAEYKKLENGLIEVKNTCEDEQDKKKVAKGIARQKDPNINAKLEVSFFDIFGWRPIWGDYWVLHIDENYTLSVIGDKESKYGWILSRKKIINKSQLKHAKFILSQNGYNAKKLLYTTQK